MKKILLVTLISVVALLIHGYQFSTGDQSIYVPQVLKKVDPSLFPHDHIVQNIQEGNLSIFFSLIAAVIKITQVNIEWLYFLLYIIVHLIIFIAIYNFSYSISKNTKAAWLSTIFLSLPKYVGGSTITTLDTQFLPRFFVLPFFLISLKLLYEKKYFKYSLLTSLIFLIHPFTAIFLISYLGGELILQKVNFDRIKSAAIGLMPLVPVVVIYLKKLGQTNNPPLITSDWLQTVQARLSYNFVSHWGTFAWISLSISLLIVFLDILFLSRKHHQNQTSLAIFLKNLTITSVLISLTHIVLGEIFKFSFILQLQLMRIWLGPIYLSLIAASWLLVKLFNSPKKYLRLLTIAGVILISTNFGRVSRFEVEKPWAKKREWVQLQHWIRNNTPQESLIITPATRTGFRIYSQRSIIGEIKDGSSSLYDRNLGLEWRRRMGDLGLLLKTEAEVLSLKNKYQADYLVTFKPKKYQSITQVYKTESFIVYKL